MFFVNRVFSVLLLILSNYLAADYLCDVSAGYNIGYDNEKLRDDIFDSLDKMITALHEQEGNRAEQVFRIPIAVSSDVLNEEKIFHIIFLITIIKTGNLFSFGHSMLKDSEAESSVLMSNIEYPHFEYCFSQWLSKQFLYYQLSNSRTDL